MGCPEVECMAVTSRKPSTNLPSISILMSLLILSEHPFEIACPGDVPGDILMYPSGLTANQPGFILHGGVVTHRWRMNLHGATRQKYGANCCKR